MTLCEVKHLYKTYPAFSLCDVSFSLEPGKITGFIGETMEWRRSDASDYVSVNPENLDYGTYYVRMKGDGNHEAGKDVVIVLRSPVTTKAPTEITANSVKLNGTATSGTGTVTYQYRKVGSDECKEGKINPDYLKGASFTVSNIGSMGCEAFTPVVNPPQTGILGVCNIQTRIKSAKDGVIETYPAMGLSLTFDHRVLDGAPAARFMSELCKNLESFMTLLAK